ncbi:efflux RND transporter periplasmic adaptor subunit [Mesorhizobium sp. NBSH29]|uniref:efflux RND transporter periplasmic adaptor subunit n=1 Tax=Mesorhizobium sp. NBSH29 TaxID=2654249 RepID=UPI001896905E|nr:efflux RND transporter periplasmic adaptor subunit [Mesorhizobium sp. NBSH29]QPC85502.1 efflux RND transporter periplasmic adaptor subunit [Mesorhizobium sp. NBSH29]
MSVWKQIALSIVVLMAAFAAWVWFFPGASQVMARWGIDWASAATPKAADAAAGNRQDQGERRGRGGGAGQGPVLVATEPVQTATINDRLQAIGTGRASATVTVTPYSAGRLTEFLVSSGAHVKKGEVVAKLDSETEEIALNRAKIARDDNAAKVKRLRSLRASNAVSSVQLADAEVAARNAELAVSDAELALNRRSIASPIAGVVGILPIEAGNYVTSQSALATIDDRSSILVDFWVPERFAALITQGAELEARSLAGPGTVFKGTVAAVDNRVDQKSRTLLVQAKIDNPSDALRAGMSFQVEMRFAGDTYPSVSPLAIQWGTEGAFVWTVVDNKTKRVLVRIIQRNTDEVLVDADIAPGQMVVTEGVQSVREGADVRVAGAPVPASGS